MPYRIITRIATCNNEHLPCFFNVKSYHNNCAKITNLNLKGSLHINTYQNIKLKQLVLFLFYKIIKLISC
ncbi:hypothetical protein [uncultured Gammaproteobacteria bacterium]|nr:hypothetical protein [uncultured Gammaproteobacteria bacterium]